jgi:hypothetical protein
VSWNCILILHDKINPTKLTKRNVTIDMSKSTPHETHIQKIMSTSRVRNLLVLFQNLEFKPSLERLQSSLQCWYSNLPEFPFSNVVEILN